MSHKNYILITFKVVKLNSYTRKTLKMFKIFQERIGHTIKKKLISLHIFLFLNKKGIYQLKSVSVQFYFSHFKPLKVEIG